MKEVTKSFPVSKRMVYNSYLNVSAKNGSAGIDKESIKMFEENLGPNLYKIWNRMSSGSYFPPPVRTVLIDKKQGGGKRPLGIPTVSDRIGQGVVKNHLEPVMEQLFHPCSFGYRPGRSAHDALAQCHVNCLSHSWVLDVDIKGFFDNINHEILLDMLALHTQENWVKLYVKRWLKAGIEQKDGSIEERTKGTPQGGVISPLLANLYLHHAYDAWMATTNNAPFERYADDIVIHCQSREEAERLWKSLENRLGMFGLTLHPEKTKIVYCKNYLRNEVHEDVANSFTFLSYTFRPRIALDKFGRKRSILLFNGSISSAAKTSIRESIRKVLKPKFSNTSWEHFAEVLNPKIRGWINYYGKFYKNEVVRVFIYIDGLLLRWIRHKYKLHSWKKCLEKFSQLKALNPHLYYHWRLGDKK